MLRATSTHNCGFLKDDRGSIAILTQAFFVLTLAIACAAIDLGSLYSEQRRVQGATDLAAMAAANDPEHAQAAARATLAANGVNVTDLKLIPGTYQPNIAVPYKQRFVADRAPFNAMRVNVATTSRTFFAGIFGHHDYSIKVTSIGASTALASFSLGSRLLAVRGGGPNAVLGQMLGSNITLSVTDYDQLLSANISLLSFLDALRWIGHAHTTKD